MKSRAVHNRRKVQMKVSREQAAHNRERVVEAAAQLFRQRGFDGIGVADLMKEAGLTHGGFYGHFSSKENLVAGGSGRGLPGCLGGLRGGPGPGSRDTRSA